MRKDRKRQGKNRKGRNGINECRRGNRERNMETKQRPGCLDAVEGSLGRQRAAKAQSRSDVLETVWNQAVFRSTPSSLLYELGQVTSPWPFRYQEKILRKETNMPKTLLTVNMIHSLVVFLLIILM